MGLFRRKHNLPKVAPDFPASGPLDEVAKTLERLQEIDPGFTAEGFLEEARDTFLYVRERIWAGEPQGLDEVLGGIALDKLTYQARRNRERNRLHHVEGLQVLEKSISRVPGGTLDLALGVRFRYSTQVEQTRDATSNVVLVDHGGSHHTEDWVFVRSAGQASGARTWLVRSLSVLA